MEDNLDSNLSLFVESNMSRPGADNSLFIIRWRYLKKVDFSFAFESAGSDLHAIDSLMA